MLFYFVFALAHLYYYYYYYFVFIFYYLIFFSFTFYASPALFLIDFTLFKKHITFLHFYNPNPNHIYLWLKSDLKTVFFKKV